VHCKSPSGIWKSTKGPKVDEETRGKAGGRSTRFRNGMYDIPRRLLSRRASPCRCIFRCRPFSSLLVPISLVVITVGRISTNLKPAGTLTGEQISNMYIYVKYQECNGHLCSPLLLPITISRSLKQFSTI